MRRRVVWKYGDSPPVFGNILAAVEGDGELRVYTGFPVSSAEVSFAKICVQSPGYGYGYGPCQYSPEIFVSEVHEDGFTITYRNIVESLNVNYIVM